MKQFVEPSVSVRKFEREIADYRNLEAEYRQRGWILVQSTFPGVLVLMVARQLPVPAIVTAVRFDYTNYDFEPPSVQLVDPFSLDPYRAANLPTRLDRQVSQPNAPMLPLGAPQIQMVQVQPYMQWHSPDEVPFLCMPGVREYHHHPAHSGDAWELHRKSGAGRLVRLLEVIHRYGIAPIDNLAIQLQIVPQIQGFHANPPQ